MNWRKVGRNEICPCGSGKKYKKCCGQEDPDTIDRGEVLRETVMEVVDNQLRHLNPPEAVETFNRLLAEGYNEDEARHFIGSAMTCEILIVMRTEQPFNLERYKTFLSRLPDPPWRE